MTKTILQNGFAPIKKYLPSWVSNPIRSFFTAVLTPILFSYRTGHFLSSFKMMPVSRSGKPLPWYTYPAIDFLKYRTYENKIVLEFGGGQSSLWWAKRAKHVVTLEGDRMWYEQIKKKLPQNAEIHLISMENVSACIAQVEKVLNSKSYSEYDIIIIDGLYRYEMIEIALKFMSNTGVIICDNSEGYGFYEGFKNTSLNRVDFCGNAPGVVLPHCTSLYFKHSSFMFNATWPIPVIAHDRE